MERQAADRKLCARGPGVWTVGFGEMTGFFQLYNLQEQCAWVCLHGLGGIPEKVYLSLSGTL